MMNGIFSDLISHRILVYLDDVTIYSPTFDHHLNFLRTMLTRFCQEELFLKPSKYIFATDQVQILGFVVNKDRLKTDPDKVAAVAKYPRPTDCTTTRAFIGLAMYYRRFIEDF